jgi:hypothetical protein
MKPHSITSTSRIAHRNRLWGTSLVLFSIVMVGVTASLNTASAAELKVDLNQNNGRKDALSQNWENWIFENGKSASKTFGNVTVTVRSPSGDELAGVMYKGALDYGARMAADGIRLQEPAGREAIEMVISGLSPGRHTLVTYHNETDVTAPTPLDILVGDEVRTRGLLPTQRSVNDYDVASAFIEFTAQAGKDVVIRFRPREAGAKTSVVINGFEIDTVDPAKKAIKPSPAHNDEHVAENAPLSWTPSKTAKAHVLYFGTDRDAVASATTTSPEFKGRLTAPTFALSKLDHMKAYFWRVDEIHNGEAAPTRGEVWRFRPRFLAFPTAEGYGRFARGGRGGRVIEVTNLDDYDTTRGEAAIPGSYRAAIEAEGPRTVVFRVSGIIRLKRPCTIFNPYCTVAGQTAPGDGICIANYSSGAYSSHDAIIRFMRFRVGDFARKGVDGAGLGNCDHAIMDHCSISWASDEGTSSRGAKNITFQRNIVAESLQHSYHYRASDRTKFETHAFAGSISGNIGSFHHNLLAHCTDRNWSLAGGYNQSGQYDGYLDIRNNVVYNWTGRTTDGGVMQMNYVNNYYKPYPQNPFVKWLLKLDPIGVEHGTPKYFMSGNVMEGFDYEDNNWKAFTGSAEVQKLVRVDSPLFESFVTTQTAREAFPNVLANVGATFPKQDVIDRRIIEEARTGTVHYMGTKAATWDRPSRNFPGIIDTQNDVKDAVGSPNFPWPEYRTYNVPVDRDHDGMPDDWERRAGLNLNEPADGNTDRDGDGYTNLEEYLGWLVGEFTGPKA